MTPRSIARQEGKKTYDGIPCLRGHGGKRYVSNQACVECRHLQKARVYYEKVGDKGRNRKYAALIQPRIERITLNTYDKTTDIGKWIHRSKTGKHKKARKELLVTHYLELVRTHCPLLNIELDYQNYGTKKMPDNYATLDKINPKLGYVPGNVQIISYRANTIKNSATLAEMKLIVKNWSKM